MMTFLYLVLLCPLFYLFDFLSVSPIPTSSGPFLCTTSLAVVELSFENVYI